MLLRKTYIVLIFSILLIACKSHSEVQLPSNPKGFNLLSEYKLFEGLLSDLKPVKGVIPYDINNPLFSDYAEKARFIWMPEGKTASPNEDGSIQYPEGTILVKNFFFTHENKRQIVETRLLIKFKSKWEVYPYVWNKEQTDAEIKNAGALVPVTFTHLKKEISFKYSVPNKFQCKNCHNADNVLLPIGPKIAQLNKLFPYNSGTINQLDYWEEIGYLDYHRSPETPIMTSWENANINIEQRAKAYLDGNCAHCHNPKGSASTSGLFLQFTELNPMRWGICKTPVAAGRGSGGKTFDISPQHPEESILLYRMESDDPGVMMPEIGRKLVHQEAVDLIYNWIKNMEETPCN
ncbi:MAG: hypothetical protein LC105_09440 [Chitinophagales bacterium]|nr:hypothetical protein [Chitinophagales bacterium]